MHIGGELQELYIKDIRVCKARFLIKDLKQKLSTTLYASHLMLEPRGHRKMYGAILRLCTELTAMRQAQIRVLSVTNEGYSNMCGHATIALGRSLFDVRGPEIFSKAYSIGI
jgi:proline racemase